MFIPGRIEFLGKHTDYCGGRSLVCAIGRGFHVDFDTNSSRTVGIVSEDSGERVSFSLTGDSAESAPWANYPRAVIRRIARNFTSKPLKGVDIRFRSDLPQAAGLSSSSAFMIAVFLSISEANELAGFEEYQQNIRSGLELAEYLGCVENGSGFRALEGDSGVGTFGGSQDHTAIINCRSGSLSQFSYAPVRHESDLAFPDDHSFVVASSGVIAEKTGEAKDRYNRVSRMVSEIVAKWPGGERTLAAIIEDAGMDELERFVRKGRFVFGTDEMIRRVRQFYAESFGIVPQVASLIEAGHIGMIGGMIDISQRNAEKNLQNQTPETIFLQRSARGIGCVAASAFGAGFGGSVYALVRTGEAEEFMKEWEEKYREAHPKQSERAEFFTTQTSQARI